MVSTSPAKKGEIVLLEEADLYQYHQHGASMLEASDFRLSEFDTAIHKPLHHKATPGGAYQAMKGTPYAPSSTMLTMRSDSIDTVPTNYGAFRPGGPVNLFSREYVGLLLNWIIIGFFNGAIPALVYPLFGVYLGYEDFQANVVFTLFDMGWYFKFVFGFITDTFPIQRQRRKPYMYIGWVVFMGFMLAMGCMSKVEPYMRGEDIVNEDAPSQGPRYVLPIMISSFAHLLSTVACEGMMIEFTHREGEFERGSTLCLCVVFRFIGEILGSFYVSLGCNSQEYGGSFTQSVPLDWLFGSFAVVAFLGLVVTYYLLTDHEVPTTVQPASSKLRQVWRFLEQRTTLQVLVVVFFVTLALNFNVTVQYAIFEDWLGTDTLVQNIVLILQMIGYLMAAMIVSRWLLNTNWRKIMIGGYVIVTIIQLPVELMTTFDVVRDSALFLIKDQISSIFECMVWVVRLIVIVEIAEPGLESTSYGLLTTVANLAGVFYGTAQNYVAATFDPEMVDLQADTSEVRWHVAYEFLFKQGVRLAIVLAVMPLLPRQKRHLMEIKVRGAPNLLVPIVLLTLFGALFVASMTSSLMALFPSTACLQFAGGSGCDLEVTE